jgi:hypothetical protein
MNNQKKALLSALVLAAIVAIAAASFATFTAQTNNPNNKFATGTLVLGNQKNTATECLSTAGGSTDTNSNASCDTLVNLSVQKPGDGTNTNVVLTNHGSLAGTNFRLYMPSCTDSDVSTEAYHGTGSVCGALEIYVQQYTDNTFGTPSSCIYGGGTSSTCAFDPAKNLTDFTTNYNSTVSGINLSALPSGQVNYYRVYVLLPSTSDNTLQGRQAVFNLDWYLAQ